MVQNDKWSRSWNQTGNVINDTKFYAGNFLDVEKLFVAKHNSRWQDANRTFQSEMDAKRWLNDQKWFRIGVNNGIIKKNYGFYCFNVECGTYGGFLGLFEKKNSKSYCVIIDQQMLTNRLM